MSRRGGRRALIVGALVAAALLPAAPAAAKPKNFYGMDTIAEPTKKDFRLMAKSGVQVFRMPVSWRAIEPRPPIVRNGKVTYRYYNWNATDRMIRRGSKFGIRMHVGFNETPVWLFPEDHRTSPMQSEEGKIGWRDFVAAFVDRYGPDGEYWHENPRIPEMPPVTYQIWNEQNTAARYQPKPDPAEYAKLLRIAGKEINTRDRGVEIIPGGMFGTPLNKNSLKAWVFMRKLLRQKAVKPYIDAVAIHPYSPNLRGVRYQIRKMRKALRKAGFRKLPIQITELGWSSQRSDRFFFFKGPRGQARLLRRSYRLIHKKRRKWKIERTMWFAWRDVDPSTVDKACFCDAFGLVTKRLKPKRSLRAYRRFSLGKR